MPDSPLSELRGKRRITVPLDAGRAPALAAAAEVVLGDDPLGGELQVLIADRPGAGDPRISELRELHRWRLGRKSFPLVTVIRPSSSDGETVAAEPGTLQEPTAMPGAEVRQPQQPGLLTDRGETPPVRERWLGARAGALGKRSIGDRRRVLVLGPDPKLEPVRLSEEQAARMLQAALDEPSAVSAQRRIVGLLNQSAGTEDGAGDRPGMENEGLFSRHYLTRLRLRPTSMFSGVVGFGCCP